MLERTGDYPARDMGRGPEAKDLSAIPAEICPSFEDHGHPVSSHESNARAEGLLSMSPNALEDGGAFTRT